MASTPDARSCRPTVQVIRRLRVAGADPEAIMPVAGDLLTTQVRLETSAIAVSDGLTRTMIATLTPSEIVVRPTRPLSSVALMTMILRLTLAAPAASSDDIETVADAYLAAIQGQHWSTMAAFLDEHSHYQDFTMEHFGREAIDLVGREAIIDFWRQSSASVGTSAIRYDETKRFVAGPCVVLDFEIRVTTDAAAWGVAGGGEIELGGTLITFLRIEEGTITHHHDHVDYAAAERQVTALQAERGTIPRARDESDDD